MRRLLILIALFVSPALLSIAPPTRAANLSNLSAQPATRPATQPSEFVRFVEDGHGGGQLQVAMAGFVDDARGVRVDLLSAIHVADASFFEQLNRRFAQYDVVLYEMITDGTSHAHIDRDGVPASHQRLMRELGLQSQLQAIDYSRGNFAHADLSWPQIARLERIKDRAEPTVVGRMMVNLARGLSKTPEQRQMELSVTEDLLASTKAPPAERSRLWRRAIARGMVADTRARFGRGTVSAEDAVLITARNDRAMSALDSELSAGTKHVAILFGAGHMPDFERRLVADRGLRRASTEWLTVWTVDDDAPSPSARTGATAGATTIDPPEPAMSSPLSLENSR
jgi:hypothetical protein